MGAEAAPNGLSGVSTQKLWAHAERWLAVAREFEVTETVAQQAHCETQAGPSAFYFENDFSPLMRCAASRTVSTRCAW
jgi:hypothetical protein